MTETLTDITALVDGAFSEMECDSEDDTIGHDGDQFAYAVYHDCAAGIRCRAHYELILDMIKTELAEDIAEYGNIWCGDCDQRFPSVADFVKVYVL